MNNSAAKFMADNMNNSAAADNMNMKNTINSNSIAGDAAAHFPAEKGKEVNQMTKQFFLSSPVEGHFYQTAFFMFVHDVARLAALGKSPKAAFGAAKRAVEHLGLSAAETAMLDDLMQIWHDDRHIETTFLMNGKTKTAKVSWTQTDRYPTVG